jgi:hypothetical protein
MQMNAHALNERLGKALQVQEPQGGRRLDAAPQELGPNEQPPSQDRVNPYFRDEICFETFIGGAGI